MKTFRSMKNILLLFFYIISFSTCNNKNNYEKKYSSSNNLINDVIPENDVSNYFLDLFSDIDHLNFHVYPPKWDSTGTIIKTPFEGQIIDVNKYSYCDNERIFLNIQSCKDGLSNIYAIGKFKINDKYLGLIVRQYSQYEESLIQLLLWNIKEKKIIRGIDLADSFGDEGWFFIKESWISKTSNFKIITRKKEFEFTDSNMIRILTDSLKATVFSNEKFVATVLPLSDTIKYSLKNMEN